MQHECVFKGQFRVHGGGFLSFELPLYMCRNVCLCVCVWGIESLCVYGGGLLWELPTHPPPSKKGCIKEEGGEAPLSLCSQTQRQSLWTHTFLQGHSDYPQKRSTCSYWILPEEDFLTEKRRGANLKDTQHLQSGFELQGLSGIICENYHKFQLLKPAAT